MLLIRVEKDILGKSVRLPIFGDRATPIPQAIVRDSIGILPKHGRYGDTALEEPSGGPDQYEQPWYPSSLYGAGRASVGAWPS